MLSCTEAGVNANKFYKVVMDGDGTVTATWGRINPEHKGQSAVKGNGESCYRSTIEAKTRKGKYTEVAIVGSSSAGAMAGRSELAAASRRELAGSDPTLATLVDRLVAINAHNIKTASGGQIVVADGQVKTALGVLSKDAVLSARDMLVTMRDTGYNDSQVNRYLRLVPQVVPRVGGWAEHYFTEVTSFADQESLLDQLEASVSYVASQAEKTDEDSAENMFRYRLKKVTSKSVIAGLRKRFDDSSNRHHSSSAAQMRTVYELSDKLRGDQVAAASKKVGNVKSLWHGSRAANVLSILSSGFVVPPASASHVTARMFGDGIYMSEQSTKSLNYSRGGVWSSGRDNRYFMFSVDAAMGSSFRPAHHMQAHSATNRRGHNSIDVRAGSCNVMNHEAIVWEPDQLALRYLIEFEG